MFGLEKDEIEKIIAVFEKYSNIEKVIIYGSRAKGNNRRGSDIDLTLVGKSLSLSELLKIENDLDDLLLPYQFDVSIYHAIDNAQLVEHIERIGSELYNKK